MNRSLIGELVLKDWRLYRPMILSCMVAGVGALALSQWGNEPTLVVGAVVFFIAIIMAGTMLPLAGILTERKNKHLAFLMSLPITFLEYTTAKLISTLLIFLLPWLTLVILAISVIEFRNFVPHGVIPMTLILCGLPFVGMCIMIAAALVGESEGWGIAANVFCQSSYGLAWYFLNRIPVLHNNASKPKPVWESGDAEHSRRRVRTNSRDSGAYVLLPIPQARFRVLNARAAELLRDNRGQFAA